MFFVVVVVFRRSRAEGLVPLVRVPISNNLPAGCYPDRSATPSGACSVGLSESVT